MQVHPEKRRMGIGAAMLKNLEEAMVHSTTYCLPYAHLERFYGAAGFIRCPIDAMPQHLGERLAAQQNAGLSVIGMRRPRAD